MDFQSDTKDDHSDLTSLFTRALADLFSQAGRIAPDHKLVQDVAMTAFAGGIVDDRKYIVCFLDFQ
jgi:hypothetical protein